MPSSEPRDLTANEAALVRWLLERGEVRGGDLLDSVPSLKVVGGCPCGCPTVYFRAPGQTPKAEPLQQQVFEDAHGNMVGAYLEVAESRPTALEIWWLDGEPPSEVPDPATMRCLT